MNLKAKGIAQGVGPINITTITINIYYDNAHAKMPKNGTNSNQQKDKIKFLNEM